ncbi:hypothetical protein C5E51_26085 [Nocardia nova]|nr:hypothetical protein C5E51_26085 [Nocardia nova]
MHKRRIREIDGMPVDLVRAWPPQAEAITVRLAQLSTEFQSKYHREPTPKFQHACPPVAGTNIHYLRTQKLCSPASTST